MYVWLPLVSRVCVSPRDHWVQTHSILSSLCSPPAEEHSGAPGGRGEREGEREGEKERGRGGGDNDMYSINVLCLLWATWLSSGTQAVHLDLNWEGLSLLFQ